MESISIIKGATSVKKEAAKVQRQKSFFFAQIPHAFIQCRGGARIISKNTVCTECVVKQYNGYNFTLL